MATIETTFTLNDQMTAKLQKIGTSLVTVNDKLANALSTAQNFTVQPISTELNTLKSATTTVADGFANLADTTNTITVEPIIAEISTLSDVIDLVEDSFGNWSTPIEKSKKAFDGVKSIMDGVLAKAADLHEKYMEMGEPLPIIKKALADLKNPFAGLKDKAKSWVRSIFDAVNATNEVAASTKKINRPANVVNDILRNWKIKVTGVNQALELVSKVWGRISSIASQTINYARAELATNMRLAQSVRVHADNLDIARENYYKVVNAAQQLSQEIGVGEGALREGAAGIIRYTGNVEMAVKSMETLANMAMATSMNLEVGTYEIKDMGKMLGRIAQEGNFRLLGRAGVNVEHINEELFKAADATERLKMIMQAVENDFEGFARAVANTPIGNITKMSNAMGDFREQIGNTALQFKGAFAAAFLEVAPLIASNLQGLLDGISTLITNNMATIKQAVAIGFGVFFTAKDIVKTAFSTIVNIIGTAKNIIVDNISTIGIVFMGVGLSLSAYFIPKLILTTKKLAIMGVTALATAAKWVKAWAIKLGPITLVGIAITALGGILHHFFGDTEDGFAVIKDILKGFLELGLNIVNNLANSFLDFANFLGNVFNDPIAAIINLFRNMGDRVLSIVEPIVGILDRILGTDMRSGIERLRGNLHSAADALIERHGNGSYTQHFERVNLTTDGVLGGISNLTSGLRDTFSSGFGMGMDVADAFGNAFEKFDGFDVAAFGGGVGAFDNISGFNGNGSDSPFNFDGQGNLKTAQQGDVSIRGENLRMLVDINRRRYAQEYRRSEPIRGGSVVSSSSASGRSIVNNYNLNIDTIRETADADAIIDKFIRDVYQDLGNNAAMAY
ncbi:MAG: hypothetical protein FWG64_03035 [Firmicutes bacterium]|nr:hypothetical protein [Bacillota bacterium]